MTIYLFPGVGCDARLFDRLELEDLDVVKLEWPAFQANDTLEKIAARMRPAVNTEAPHVLVGVSMGGMVAQELALLTKPEKVILISSWTGPQEWPMFVRFSAELRLYLFINHFTMWLTWPVKRMLGQRDRVTDKLLWTMAVEQGAPKIRRGLSAILSWKGTRWKGPLTRIHGDSDHVVPLRFPVDHVVRGGAHIMVLTRAEEVSIALRKALAV